MEKEESQKNTNLNENKEPEKENGSNEIYVASSCPEIINKNVYGIDIPDKNELICHRLTNDAIKKEYDIQHILFQDLKDLENSINEYQKLISLNNLIEKKFQHNSRKISQGTKCFPNLIFSDRNSKIRMTFQPKSLFYNFFHLLVLVKFE